MSSRLLIFQHLPHTGGTTLKQILRRHYGTAGLMEYNGDLTTAIQAFEGISAEKRERVQCIFGHIPFGIHHFLPRPADYITFMRDPVERVISAYYYSLRASGHSSHQVLNQDCMDLETYVATEKLWNLQTRMISGADGHFSDLSSLGMLELAKKNLADSYCFVGVTERYDHSLCCLKNQLGWKRIHYIKRNVSKRSPMDHKMSRLLEEIQERNQLDMSLYEFAQERLEESLLTQGVGRNDVRVLQMQSRIYSMFLSPWARALDLARRNSTFNNIWFRVFRRYVIQSRNQ